MGAESISNPHFGNPLRDTRSQTHLEPNVIPANVAKAVATAADVDYSGHIGGRKEFRHDEVREQEVADMVRAELRLETIDGLLVRHRHHGRVVDENVNGLRPGEDLCGRLADLGLRTEVELERAGRDTRVGGLELFGGLSALRGTTSC